MEKAAQTGQVAAGTMAEHLGRAKVKAAEVKEAEVRLAQAKRRLARLSGQANPARDGQRSPVDQRAAELEKKLDALKKELDTLRKELQPQRPRQ